VRQIELLRHVLDALERLEISYAVVGSFASGAWGEPRMTRDIDIVVRLTPSQVETLCAAFPEDEFYVSLPAAREALRSHGQFNVIHPSSGNKIDFMVVGSNDWSTAQLARRQRVEFAPDTAGYIAAPEDVIVGKLIDYREGGSEKHLRDIAGILTISDSLIDRDYIAKFSAQLGVSDIWQAVIDRVDKPSAG
jgi:hypothetical protein